MIRILLIELVLLCSHYAIHGQQTKLVLPIGHTKKVIISQFSPDGKKVITASLDNTIKVWDSENGVLLFNLVGHVSPVRFIRFSPDGQKLFSGSNENPIVAWDLETGEFLYEIKEYATRIHPPLFNADGNQLITTSIGNSTKIWDIHTGKLIHDLVGNHYAIDIALLNADRKRIYTTSIDSRDTIVKCWNLDDGKFLFNLVGHHSKIGTIAASPDGKLVLTSARDSTAKFWTTQGKFLKDLPNKALILNSEFSADSKKLLTFSNDGVVRVWNPDNSAQLFELKTKSLYVFEAAFDQDGKGIFTISSDGTLRKWDGSTGEFIYQATIGRMRLSSVQINNAQKTFTTLSTFGNTITTRDIENGSLLSQIGTVSSNAESFHLNAEGTKVVITPKSGSNATIKNMANGSTITLVGYSIGEQSVQFNPNGKMILTTQLNQPIRFWDTKNGRFLFEIRDGNNPIRITSFSSDGSKLLTISNGIVTCWNSENGKALFQLSVRQVKFHSARFNRDAKKIVTTASDKIVRIHDVDSKKILELKGHLTGIWDAQYSNDNKMVASIAENVLITFNAEKGEILYKKSEEVPRVAINKPSVQFSPDGRKILVNTGQKLITVRNAESGDQLFTLKTNEAYFNTATFSHDGTKILTNTRPKLSSISSTQPDDQFSIWDVNNGTKLWGIKRFIGKTETSVQFSPDSKQLITFENAVIFGFQNAPAFDATIWDINNKKVSFQLKGHTSNLNSGIFSPDGKIIVTSSADNTIRVWDVTTQTLLYSLIDLGDDGYLTVDKDNRYDGTPEARKLLYFTCGSEVIDLEQVKESLWVPDLVERINRGEKINNPKLSELNICGLTPTIKEDQSQGENYSFTIVPGKGGLGETTVLVNGVVTKRYKPDQLRKVKEGYQLSIPKSLLEPYFVKGKKNPIVVKSYTSSNTISSRGIEIEGESKDRSSVPPNLYGIVVGVSDYKGEKLKLKYADKDAQEIGNAINLASKKYLNTDGREHVFLYTLNTDTPRYSYPDKSNIRHIFDTIAKKATANDILLIFFAGHGVVEGESKKQFYFLTSEASSFTNVDSVGISIQELIDWIKPEKIKAQKRILIIDACNSAAAINEISKNQELIAVRNTSSAEEKKEIERLNDQAGLYVLSASASNQSAYEFSRYSQGLLTYTLLRAIKQQPDILENNKYLNLSNWFKAAKKSVGEILTQSGNSGRQEPQILVNTDFNIGIVDQEVKTSIKLADEKPIFTRSEFRNSETRVDNLRFRALIDKRLTDQSRGTDNKLLYEGGYEGSEAYSFSGDYTVKGNEIIISVFLIKGGTEIINKTAWPFTGKADQLESLAEKIVNKGIENLPKK